MRVNIYAEEMTNRVELITKQTAEGSFTGLRFYLELPCTIPCFDEKNKNGTKNVSGPFLHHPGDDDSAAVTFWGKKDLKIMLQKALALLEAQEPK